MGLTREVARGALWLAFDVACLFVLCCAILFPLDVWTGAGGLPGWAGFVIYPLAVLVAAGRGPLKRRLERAPVRLTFDIESGGIHWPAHANYTDHVAANLDANLDASIAAKAAEHGIMEMEPTKQMTAAELAEMFAAMPRSAYTKQGTFIYRDVEFHPGTGRMETVLTVVAGKLETMRTAIPGDKIVRNIVLGGSAETYVVPTGTFWERYSALQDEALYIDGHTWWKAEARGRITAAEYTGEPFEFVSPWNTGMVCEPGDFLAATLSRPDEVYRIERATFDQTYRPSEDDDDNK